MQILLVELFLFLGAKNNAAGSRNVFTIPPNSPKFLSRGHTSRVKLGDTMVLPCEVENLGKSFNYLHTFSFSEPDFLPN